MLHLERVHPADGVLLVEKKQTLVISTLQDCPGGITAEASERMTQINHSKHQLKLDRYLLLVERLLCFQFVGQVI